MVFPYWRMILVLQKFIILGIIRNIKCYNNTSGINWEAFYDPIKTGYLLFNISNLISVIGITLITVQIFPIIYTRRMKLWQ